jgi:hypothetical protein
MTDLNRDAAERAFDDKIQAARASSTSTERQPADGNGFGLPVVVNGVGAFGEIR